jgi:hypothetical protein
MPVESRSVVGFEQRNRPIWREVRMFDVAGIPCVTTVIPGRPGCHEIGASEQCDRQPLAKARERVGSYPRALGPPSTAVPRFVAESSMVLTSEYSSSLGEKALPA